jgi:hypothetical protein
MLMAGVGSQGTGKMLIAGVGSQGTGYNVDKCWLPRDRVHNVDSGCWLPRDLV